MPGCAREPSGPRSSREDTVPLALTRRLARATAVCISPALSSAGLAQLPSDSGARMERVADGVYAIIHRDATREWPSGATDWPHGNTGVVIGDAGILVVDATFYPSRARADIALIRRLSDRPVRYLVNTHGHGAPT